MESVLKGTGEYEVSQDYENQIDALRNSLRTKNTEYVDEGVYSFAVGTIFMDLVRESEKCGDYLMNVVEAKMGKRDNVPDTGVLHIDVIQKTAIIGDTPLELDHTEFELLSLLSSNPGRVFSKLELQELVWPQEAVGDRVVDDYIRNIRLKLGTFAGHISSKAGYGYYYE